MDGATPPTGKEPAGFLMSIVRTLSDSTADYEQREKEKTRIEKLYRESDKRLTELVQGNYNDISKIIQSFTAMTRSINESRDRIRKIKEDLVSCKTLLHFKRDELRKLWRDGVEHKAVLQMLDQVEHVKEVPDKMDDFLQRKHYLHATELIVNAVAIMEKDLQGVDALRDLRSELTMRRERLHETLIEELNRQIYERSVQWRGFYVRGSLRVNRKDGSLKSFPDSPGKMRSGRDSPGPVLMEDDELGHGQDVMEDLTMVPEDNPPRFIAILVEALSTLHKLPEAIEAIKMRIEPELCVLMSKVSQQIIDNSYQQGDSLASLTQPRLLMDLLETVFQQFRCVARMHEIVLRNIHRALTQWMPMKSESMYDMKEIWSKMQAVLQIVLADYLDVRNTAASRQQAPTGFDEPTMDISVYFGKKRPPRPKKLSLFRFDASLHALSMKSYMEDTRRFAESAMYGDGNMTAEMTAKQKFVCKPAASNITAIYKPLKNFLQEIEGSAESTPLQEFVTDFVQTVFLGQVHEKVSESINAATRGFDALRHVVDEKSRRELGVPRPLLQSTVTVDRNISDLKDLMQDLPDYADQFLNMICNVLRDYRDKCHSAYRDIVQHGSDEKRVISAMWAKDEDISRFLRSLPSWRMLQPGETQELKNAVCSEEEMRALNSKEAVILISNLSSDETLIPQQEIITDVTQMRTVANVHESLEWFAGRLKAFSASLSSKASHLSVPSSDLALQDIPPVSDTTLSSLNSLVQDFLDLAEICLLLLHLEVRVHCFYYLLPVAKHSNYFGAIDDLDPDSNVLKLNKDLTSMEEVLAQSLQPKKFKYIFESLGYLVSSILINSVQFLGKMNENGIKKMCRNILAIQQNLTNITLTPESDLDRARQYYQLLYGSPDDMLDEVAEKGPQFTETEYSNLLQLYHRSHLGTPGSTQEGRMQRLHEIIEKGQNETV